MNMRNQQFKQQIDNLFHVAKVDYETYEQSNNIGFLRDSSEKLVALAQNIVEYKTNIYIEGWISFKKALYSNKILIPHKEKQQMVANIFTLHGFFYHGLNEGQDTNDIIPIYNSVLAKLKKIYR